MMNNNLSVVILAAGMGTRMMDPKRAGIPKVLHEICGKPMIMYVIDTAKRVANDIVIVIGNKAELVRDALSNQENIIFAIQENQRGTGDAVQCAMPYVPNHAGQVLVLCGDVPLIRRRTVGHLLETHSKENRDISVLSVIAGDPTGYGRIICDEEQTIIKIVEEADATHEQKKEKKINTGIICARSNVLRELLPKIKSDNAQDEIYLTDIIDIGRRGGKNIGFAMCQDFEETIGVNTRGDLDRAEIIMRRRQREIS